MEHILIGKEKVEDSSKYLVSRSSKKKVCEKCGEDLPDDSPYWKKLCTLCWKKNTFGKNDIRDQMQRLGESNYTHNRRPFQDYREC
jgi:hypothetical protein